MEDLEVKVRTSNKHPECPRAAPALTGATTALQFAL
jgi:hypothetical protein